MLQLPQEYCLSGICPTAFGETCCKTIAHVKKTVCFQFPEIYLLNVAIFRFKRSNVLTFAARLGLLEKANVIFPGTIWEKITSFNQRVQHFQAKHFSTGIAHSRCMLVCAVQCLSQAILF